VFPYDTETGAVLDLLHFALTNTPAIDDGAITQLAGWFLLAGVIGCAMRAIHYAGSATRE
jgi:hypothetical protein